MFVSLLLLSVVALYLSDQYDWFAFNRHKGSTVLIAVATVAAGFCLMAVWAVGAHLLMRRAQFGLATLLLMITAVALPCAWLTREMQKAQRITEAVAQIEREGGYALCFFLTKANSGAAIGFVEPYEGTPKWLLQAFGDEFFGEIHSVLLADGNRLSDVASFPELQSLDVMSGVLIGDADLDAIVQLRHLEEISFFETEISDEGLKRLSSMASLKDITIFESNVTPLGRDAFTKAFAGKCYIGGNPRLEFETFRVELEAYSGSNYDTLSSQESPPPRRRGRRRASDRGRPPRTPGGPIDLSNYPGSAVDPAKTFSPGGELSER
jgi:hypothetical protein